MFTVKLIASTEEKITSEELLNKCDKYLELINDDLHNITLLCVDYKFIKNKIYLYQGPDKPLLIQTYISDTLNDRDRFMLKMASMFKKIESRFLEKGISFEVQSEDNVTEFLGLEEWL